MTVRDGNAIDAMCQNAHKTYINLTQLPFGTAAAAGSASKSSGPEDNIDKVDNDNIFCFSTWSG